MTYCRLHLNALLSKPRKQFKTPQIQRRIPKVGRLFANGTVRMRFGCSDPLRIMTADRKVIVYTKPPTSPKFNARGMQFAQTRAVKVTSSVTYGREFRIFQTHDIILRRAGSAAYTDSEKIIP